MKLKFFVIFLVLICSCSNINKNLMGEWSGTDNNLFFSESTFSFVYKDENQIITNVSGSYTPISKNKLEFNYLKYKKKDNNEWLDFKNLTAVDNNYEIIDYNINNDRLRIINSSGSEILYIKLNK